MLLSMFLEGIKHLNMNTTQALNADQDDDMDMTHQTDDR